MADNSLGGGGGDAGGGMLGRGGGRGATNKQLCTYPTHPNHRINDL
jgi:hypothetical protein